MLRFLILLLFAALSATAYKILVYSPRLSRSHVLFMGHLADTLAEAGHNVTVFLPELSNNVNITGVKLANTIMYPLRFEWTLDEDKETQDFWQKDGSDPRQLLKIMRIMSELYAQLFQSQLEDEQMMRRLQEENFDLGISEVFAPSSLLFFEALGIRTHIAAFSTNFIEAYARPLGIDSNPSYVPAAFSHFSDEMTYLERAKNFVVNVASSLLFELTLKSTAEDIFHQRVSKDLSYDDVLASSAFAFVNAEDFTEFSRPTNNKIVYVGGIGVKKPQKLSTEFQKIMDDATGGVVFVSFGSVMKSSLMPMEMKEAFLEAFRRFPEITFIWKYETSDVVGQDLPNLVKVKWAPQNDLFGHENMRAFISHGGMNSLMECTHAGIPVVTIPLFVDQMRNSKMVEKRHVGVIVDKHNLTAQSLTDAIATVVYGKSYRKSAKKLAEMIRKKPMSAKERVVKYTEFAAEFGHIDNLDSAAAKLNFFQYYLLDIFIPITIMFILIIFISTRLFIYLLRKAFRVIKKKTE